MKIPTTHTALTVKHLDHLNLSVADLERTIDWYGRVFGFAVVERGVQEDGSPWAILRGGDALLCVYEHTELVFLNRHVRKDRGLHGINHFGLRITDRIAWEATIKRESVQVEYGGAIQYPHSLSWYVCDPTGYGIEVALWDDDRVAFDG